MGNSLEAMGKGPESFSLAAIAKDTNFSREELMVLHENFHAAAKESPDDGTSVINKEQFQAILQKSNIQSTNQGFLEELFHAFDKNNSGTVNFVEYCTGVSVMLKGTTEEKLKLSFEIYDQDKSGKISQTEMMQVLHNMNVSLKAAEASSKGFTDEDIQAFVTKIFAECDLGGDGYLSFSEFYKAVVKYPGLIEFA
jgi:Ca2+-binding EF-hand superfamily protein